MFQSAPPQGGRHPDRGCSRRSYGFNPRPRRGGDPTKSILMSSILLFQSAPPQGGRRGEGLTYYVGKRVSIRAPAGGATGSPIVLDGSMYCFNPRPRRGGDWLGDCNSRWRILFQSAPPQGGRRWRLDRPTIPREFQSAPPQGGRPSADQTTRLTPAFQSAPPQGGRLVAGVDYAQMVEVSIRAPAGGAT